MAIPPINQTTLEGEEAKFVCLTKDPDLNVVWYKDNIPLRDFQDLLKRSYVTKENTLIISPTDMGDYGEYECEVKNPEGERQTAKAFLNVQCNKNILYNNYIIILSLLQIRQKLFLLHQKFIFHMGDLRLLIVIFEQILR